MSLVISKVFTYDTDAGNYIQAVEGPAGDNQALEPAVRQAINNFVIGCKQDGIWSAIKASCILAGARTLNGALVPLAGTAPTNVGGLFVQADYNRKTGLVGNGSTKYLNSNRNNNADPQNNYHGSVYVSQATTSVANNYPTYLGVASGAPGATHLGRLENNGFLFVRCRAAGNDNFAPGTQTGLIGMARSSPTSYQVRHSLTTETITRSSDGVFDANTFVFTLNNLPIGSNYSNGRLAFYSIGESLDLAKLDARVTALITAFGAAIP